MVLGGQPPGRVGRRRFSWQRAAGRRPFQRSSFRPISQWRPNGSTTRPGRIPYGRSRPKTSRSSRRPSPAGRAELGRLGRETEGVPIDLRDCDLPAVRSAQPLPLLDRAECRFVDVDRGGDVADCEEDRGRSRRQRQALEVAWIVGEEVEPVFGHRDGVGVAEPPETAGVQPRLDGEDHAGTDLGRVAAV